MVAGLLPFGSLTQNIIVRDELVAKHSFFRDKAQLSGRMGRAPAMT